VHPSQLAEIGLPAAGDDCLPLVIRETDVSGAHALHGGRHLAVAYLVPAIRMCDVTQETSVTV
jgi:hypothetical protein